MRSSMVKLSVMAFAVVVFSGCKSGMPKWNWWSKNDENVAPTTSLSGSPLPSQTAQPRLTSAASVGTTPSSYGSTPAYGTQGGATYGSSTYTNGGGYPNPGGYTNPNNFPKSTAYPSSVSYPNTNTPPNYSGGGQAHTVKPGTPYGSGYASRPGYGSTVYPNTSTTTPNNVSRQPYGTAPNTYSAGPAVNYGTGHRTTTPNASNPTYNPTGAATSPSPYGGSNNSYVQPPSASSTSAPPPTSGYSSNLAAAPQTGVYGAPSGNKLPAATTYQPGSGAFGGNAPGVTGYAPAGVPTYQSPAQPYRLPGSAASTGRSPQPYLPGSTSTYPSATAPSNSANAPATYTLPASR